MYPVNTSVKSMTPYAFYYSVSKHDEHLVDGKVGRVISKIISRLFLVTSFHVILELLTLYSTVP